MFRDLINKPHETVGACAGLVRIAGERVGLSLPESWDELDNCYFAKVKRGQQRAGDIVHMPSMAGNIHIGVMISRTEMLHSTSKRGVHKLSLDHPWLSNRNLGIWRKIDAEDTTEHTGIVISPKEFAEMARDAQDDDGQTLAYISLAVLAAVVSYGTSAALAGMASASFWGSVASMATMTAGGMIINNNLGPADIDQTADDSPTYGWSAGSNTAREGIAIPVIYGHVQTCPNVINQWIEVDANGDQWSHNLLCNGEGKTDNVPTANDIYVNNQPISTLDDDAYSIETTYGSQSQSALTNHEKLHQMRSANTEMTNAVMSNVLLHFDGTNGSTDIVDDSIGVAVMWEYLDDSVDRTNTWTCHNTAALSTAHATETFSGTACLNLETSGDYISCDQPPSFMGFWPVFDFECRWRQDSLTDSAIAGQNVKYDNEYYHWGIFYVQSTGDLVYQYYKWNSGTGIYTVYFNLPVSVTLSVDTWHHIRVARASEIRITRDSETGEIIEEAVRETTFYFYIDGVLIDTYSFNDVEDPDNLDHPGAEIVHGSDAHQYQYVGRANYYNGSSMEEWYGCCELDELRMVALGCLYGYDTEFDVPTNQIYDDNEHTYLTQCEIDSFSIMFSCPSGLFRVFTQQGWDDTGSYYHMTIYFLVAYRAVGSTTWHRSLCSFTGNQTSPIYKQFDFTPSASRGLYEIRITRLAFDSNTDMYRDVSVCMISHIDEILHESLTYPHLQLTSVSLRATDKYSGQIPTIKINNNRSTIEVDNYDCAGTRIVDATDNANVAFDAATNRVYGVGLDPLRISQETWEDWSTWINGTVDGYRRAKINMVFDEANSFDEALSHIEACGRAKVMLRGNNLVAVVDQPVSTATNLYVPENIVMSTNTVTYLRNSERSDAVEITYNDVDLGGEEKTAIWRSDGYYQLTRPPQIARLKLRGVNTYEQALREAILRQQISDATQLSCKFQTGLEGILDLPGDVIEHGKGSLVYTGRLTAGADRAESYNGMTVYIDQEINLDSTVFSGNCILQVREMNSQTVRQHIVIGPFDTDTRQIFVSTSGIFEHYMPWKILRSSGDVHKFRVSTIRKTSLADVEVNGMQYDDTAYYHENYEDGEVAI